MGWLFKREVKDGIPWMDYKEGTKTAPDKVFIYKMENFLYFMLYEVCINFPAVAVHNNAQLPLKVTIQPQSTNLQITPYPLAPEFFSSPSQNFNLGTLDEEATGMRLIPYVFNYPCSRGETLLITVSGAGTGFNVGCLIKGRKYEVSKHAY